MKVSEIANLPQLEAKYADDEMHPNICPHCEACGPFSLGDQFDDDNNKLYRSVECWHCQGSWYNLYTLIENVQGNGLPKEEPGEMHIPREQGGCDVYALKSAFHSEEAPSKETLKELALANELGCDHIKINVNSEFDGEHVFTDGDTDYFVSDDHKVFKAV